MESVGQCRVFLGGGRVFHQNSAAVFGIQGLLEAQAYGSSKSGRKTISYESGLAECTKNPRSQHFFVEFYSRRCKADGEHCCGCSHALSAAGAALRSSPDRGAPRRRRCHPHLLTTRARRKSHQSQQDTSTLSIRRQTVHRHPIVRGSREPRRKGQTNIFASKTTVRYRPDLPCRGVLELPCPDVLGF